jgi:heparosan-N-sulfate-glucuronate 5-epimerase
MCYTLGLTFFVGLLVLGIIFRDIWKFFRNGFGGKIEIYLNQSTLNNKYYIESSTLFQELIMFDQNGVAVGRYGKAFFYNPAYVAWQGLCFLNRHYDTQDSKHLQEMEKQILWLERNVFYNKSTGSVWQYMFDWKEGKNILKKPWISGMAQGLIISFLVRAYVLTKKESLLKMAEEATKVYKILVIEGGIRLTENSSVFYEEYPTEKGMKILDGFIFALLGLYDLFQATQNEKYLSMFDEGVETIERNISFWDYKSKWSRYGTHRFLCTPVYNKLNSRLLNVLYSITGRKTFLRYSSAWDDHTLSIKNKFGILVVFSLVRNVWRITNFFSSFQVHRD